MSTRGLSTAALALGLFLAHAESSQAQQLDDSCVVSALNRTAPVAADGGVG